jgi:polyphenol oxidase
VARLVREYGVQPADLIAAIGPSIGPCCFQVGPEVRERFIEAAGTGTLADSISDYFSADTGDRLRLDLWRVNRDQLVAAGLDPAHVHTAGLCTMTHVAQFYSYRREQQATGRLLGVIRSRGRQM